MLEATKAGRGCHPVTGQDRKLHTLAVNNTPAPARQAPTATLPPRRRPGKHMPIGYAVRLATSHHNGGWAACAELPTYEQCAANARRRAWGDAEKEGRSRPEKPGASAIGEGGGL